jgi:hypothetical protein
MEFPGLLKALMEMANPDKHLQAAFNQLGAMKHIPSHSMVVPFDH